MRIINLLYQYIMAREAAVVQGKFGGGNLETWSTNGKTPRRREPREPCQVIGAAVDATAGAELPRMQWQ